MLTVDKKDRIKFLVESFVREGVRSDLQKTIEFQDLIGTSTNSDIAGYYETLNHADKQRFIWSCSCALSYETCMDLIRFCVIVPWIDQEGLKIQEDNQKAWEEIRKARAENENRSKHLDRIERKQKEIMKIIEGD